MKKLLGFGVLGAVAFTAVTAIDTLRNCKNLPGDAVNIELDFGIVRLFNCDDEIVFWQSFDRAKPCSSWRVKNFVRALEFKYPEFLEPEWQRKTAAWVRLTV